MDGRQTSILDASPLINYLQVERTGLLTSHPRYRFAITDHVRGEVSDRYPQQVKLLKDLIDMLAIEEIRVDRLEEVVTFAMLTKRLGQGESAAIAVAGHRGLSVTLDDRQARSIARTTFPDIELLDTIQIMVEAIKGGIISVRDADLIKDEWANKHRFRRNFESFEELLY